MQDTNVFMVLVFLALAAVLSAIFYRMRKRDDLNHRISSLPARQARTDQEGGYAEEKTRFIETRRKKTYRLLNVSEQVLYLRLEEAMPNMRLFAQVGIMQLAQLRGRVAASEAQQMLGRCVDFLVCDKDFAVVAAIELNWPTDENREYQKTAEAKKLVLEKLAIPLIYFQPHQIPGIEDIAREIAAAVVSRKHLEAARDRALEFASIERPVTANG